MFCKELRHLETRITFLTHNVDTWFALLVGIVQKSPSNGIRHDRPFPETTFRDRHTSVHLKSRCCNCSHLLPGSYSLRHHKQPATIPRSFMPDMQPLLRLAGWSPRILWYTGLEAILEFSWNALHVSHTSGSSGLSALGLLAPVVCNSC